jgi:hypothetical protein
VRNLFFFGIAHIDATSFYGSRNYGTVINNGILEQNIAINIASLILCIFLASGSDDALVMLWKLSSGPASKSFGSDELTQENWRCTATLRGHSKGIFFLQVLH